MSKDKVREQVLIQVYDILCNGCQREDFKEEGCECEDIRNAVEQIEQIYRPKGSTVMKGEASVAENFIYFSNRKTMGDIGARNEKGTLIWIPKEKKNDR